MLWGCFSASGVGQIVWIQGKINAADYINILQNKMLPFAEDEMKKIIGTFFPGLF